nr:hypothetical protein [uncultured Mediterranean phage uvMED]|tara:strand:- start:1210 stop:1458 length:249 start_codon:yes stop_codon:yes gene_type:complete
MGVYFPFLDPEGFPETPPPLGLSTVAPQINALTALNIQNGMVVSGIATFSGNIEAQDILARNLQVTGTSSLIVSFDGGHFQP